MAVLWVASTGAINSHRDRGGEGAGQLVDSAPIRYSRFEFGRGRNCGHPLEDYGP